MTGWPDHHQISSSSSFLHRASGNVNTQTRRQLGTGQHRMCGGQSILFFYVSLHLFLRSEEAKIMDSYCESDFVCVWVCGRHCRRVDQKRGQRWHFLLLLLFLALDVFVSFVVLFCFFSLFLHFSLSFHVDVCKGLKMFFLPSLSFLVVVVLVSKVYFD